MRILLTGGTGWIGRSLGTALVRRGHKIIGLTRDPRAAKLHAPFPAEWHPWSTDQEVPTAALIGGIDAVVNLLGEPIAAKRWSARIKKDIETSRLSSTEKLAAVVARHKIPTFVSASAIGFYGDRGDEILNESSAPGQGFLSELCEQWERITLKAPQARSVAVRIGIVLGRDGGALEKMLPAFQAGVGGPLGAGRQWMSWIHFQDLQHLLLECVENPKYSGVVNGTAPEPIRQKDFARTLGHVLDRPAFLPAPAVALRLLFGELAQVLLASQRVLPHAALKVGFKFQFSTLSEALRDILQPEMVQEKLLTEAQFIDRPLSEVFPFYASEQNLERITPPFLNFKVLAKNTERIEKNTLLDYRLKLHGIPFGWRTKIVEWNPPEMFVDTQLKGPYKLWHHTHRFEPLGTGTLIIDEVRYKVPMGVLGGLVAGAKVHHDVKEIFAYRRKVIGEEIWP